MTATGAVVLALVFGGCGDDEDPEPAEPPAADVTQTEEEEPPPAETETEQEEASVCERVPRAARSSLADALTADGGELRALRMVRSGENPATLGGFQNSGLVMISGELQAPGLEGDDDILTWAVSGEFAETGGGLAIGMDNVTKEFSDAGSSVNLDAVGLSTDIEAYGESRDCVEAAL